MHFSMINNERSSFSLDSGNIPHEHSILSAIEPADTPTQPIHSPTSMVQALNGFSRLNLDAHQGLKDQELKSNISKSTHSIALDSPSSLCGFDLGYQERQARILVRQLLQHSIFSQTTVSASPKTLNENALVIPSLLSTAEAQAIASLIKSHPDALAKCGAIDSSYRNHSAMTIYTPELATMLWRRISPLLSGLADLSISPGSSREDFNSEFVPNTGDWQATRVLEVIRLLHYKSGQHLGPHRDECLHENNDSMSMATLIVYLNDNDGGATNILTDEATGAIVDGINRAQPDEIVNRITPETGKALVFFHDQLHEGEQLDSGEKTILRADIMFQRREPFHFSQDELAAKGLVQDAFAHESKGDTMAAVKCYKTLNRQYPEIATRWGLA